ncbi:MAG: histidine kinase dimerization/phospho-acceptor domain-containing protein [Bacteroidota bacterium]
MNPLPMIKKTLMRYPAIIAAYFIYGYYFLSTMQFYIDFKHKSFGGIDILQHFDTVLWMWALSYVLVKVLEQREALEKQRLELDIRRLEAEKESTQLKTLKEIVRTLHHEINNPLAVIYLHLTFMKKKIADHQEFAKSVTEIETSSKRIHEVITELSRTGVYELTDSPAGNMIDIHRK